MRARARGTALAHFLLLCRLRWSTRARCQQNALRRERYFYLLWWTQTICFILCCAASWFVRYRFLTERRSRLCRARIYGSVSKVMRRRPCVVGWGSLRRQFKALHGVGDGDDSATAFALKWIWKQLLTDIYNFKFNMLMVVWARLKYLRACC